MPRRVVPRSLKPSSLLSITHYWFWVKEFFYTLFITIFIPLALKNIGKLNGYYITNGKAIPITCTKNARNQKTIYEDMQGNQIEVNDGKTFINICPIDAEVTIE